jgi:hypothetical protein
MLLFTYLYIQHIWLFFFVFFTDSAGRCGVSLDISGHSPPIAKTKSLLLWLLYVLALDFVRFFSFLSEIEKNQKKGSYMVIPCLVIRWGFSRLLFFC